MYNDNQVNFLHTYQACCVHSPWRDILLYEYVIYIIIHLRNWDVLKIADDRMTMCAVEYKDGKRQ